MCALWYCGVLPFHPSFTVQVVNRGLDTVQRCGLRRSVLGQNRSETIKSVLVLVLVLVLQVWCYVVKHGLVMLVVIMILKDTTTFQVPFTVFARNITTVEIVHILKS